MMSPINEIRQLCDKLEAEEISCFKAMASLGEIKRQLIDMKSRFPQSIPYWIRDEIKEILKIGTEEES